MRNALVDVLMNFRKHVANARARRRENERYAMLENVTSQLIELESSLEKMHEDERQKIFELREREVTQRTKGTYVGFVHEL